MKKKGRGHALPADAPEIDGAVSRANGNGRLGQPERNATDDQAIYVGRERRDAIERRGPWRCLKCNGTEPRIAGSPGIGVQIRKCNACGMMDQRLPNDRRQRWTPEWRRGPGVQVRFTAGRWHPAVIGAAIVAALLGVLVFVAYFTVLK